tara:strand:- start:215 stop:493 length:279 start_codon:yes stop_codon:yes gene_type:complete
MRKIEERMLQAIRSGNRFSEGNTRVVPTETGRAVYLYGHHIATFNELSGKIDVNLETLKAWPTVTTKSRLRALGVNVSTRKGVTYLDGKAIE